jgi:hypothetical protein
MPNPDLGIETLQNPRRYSHAQLERAWMVALVLDRGTLVLAEPPLGATNDA